MAKWQGYWLFPRDAQRGCGKKVIVCEAASQAISVLSLAWLSLRVKIPLHRRNTNATKEGLEPLHLIGPARCPSCGM